MAHPLVPLLVLIIVLLAAAAVGYVVMTIVNDVADKTSKRMERHHVSFTKDGMKVGVREVDDESYKSQTQSVLVKAWNLSTWPAYKSRLWNKEQQEQQQQQAAAGSAQASGAKRR